MCESAKSSRETWEWPGRQPNSKGQTQLDSLKLNLKSTRVARPRLDKYLPQMPMMDTVMIAYIIVGAVLLTPTQTMVSDNTSKNNEINKFVA